MIALPYAILFHILLAFPSGRLETRGNRALAGAAYLAATVGWWICMLFQDPTRQGLPSNPLMVADEPDLFSALARIRLAIVAVLIVLLGVVLVRRFTASTSTQRRALAPVYLSGGLVLLLYAVWAVLGVARADRGSAGDARVRARRRARGRAVRVPGRTAAQPRRRRRRRERARRASRRRPWPRRAARRARRRARRSHAAAGLLAAGAR